MARKLLEVQFEGAYGDRLSGRLDLPADSPPRAHVLFAHCFTCSKDITAASHISTSLAELGFAVLRFDFTGLGHSQGEFASTNFSSNIADLVAGARYFQNDIPDVGAPLERMADHLFSQPPCPFFVAKESRADYLWKQFQAQKARGVVFMQLKFCESFNYDYPSLRDFFKSRGVPTLMVETEIPITSPEQIRTRLAAFFEIVRGI